MNTWLKPRWNSLISNTWIMLITPCPGKITCGPFTGCGGGLMTLEIPHQILCYLKEQISLQSSNHILFIFKNSLILNTVDSLTPNWAWGSFRWFSIYCGIRSFPWACNSLLQCPTLCFFFLILRIHKPVKTFPTAHMWQSVFITQRNVRGFVHTLVTSLGCWPLLWEFPRESP